MMRPKDTFLRRCHAGEEQGLGLADCYQCPNCDTSCMALGKFVLSEPLFPHWKRGVL
jgi:hypothetical protein